MRWFCATSNGWDLYVLVYRTMKSMRVGIGRGVANPPKGLNTAGAMCAYYDDKKRRCDIYIALDNLTYNAIAHESYHAVRRMASVNRKRKRRCGEEWQATIQGELVNFIIWKLSVMGFQPKIHREIIG